MKLLQSAQRPLALAICRAFRTTSTIAATFLADMLPLELELKKLVTRRAMSAGPTGLAPSAAKLVHEVVHNVNSIICSNNNSGQQRRQAISTLIWENGTTNGNLHRSVARQGDSYHLFPKSEYSRLLTRHHRQFKSPS